jgi:flagellar motor switch protein FliN/FliY
VTAADPFVQVEDLLCPVDVLLGRGRLTVGRVIGLQRQSVIRLDHSAGEDLMITVNGVILARGEVMIVEDSTAVRVTEIHVPAPDED